jgi:hypothetical protein
VISEDTVPSYQLASFVGDNHRLRSRAQQVFIFLVRSGTFTSHTSLQPAVCGNATLFLRSAHSFSPFLFISTETDRIIEMDEPVVRGIGETPRVRDLCTAEISRTCFFPCGSNAPELMKVFVFSRFRSIVTLSLSYVKNETLSTISTGLRCIENVLLPNSSCVGSSTVPSQPSVNINVPGGYLVLVLTFP